MSRKWLRSAAAALVAASLCGGAAQAQQGDPIRLGFLTIKSGALAAGGKQMEGALKLFLQGRNYTVAGRRGNPVMDVYIRKVERSDSKLVNSVVKAYPAVSPFWKYDPKEFLANPVYSRDWPPARNLEK